MSQTTQDGPDIVATMRGAVCLPDTGCISVVTCVCDILQDAADEIEMLRERVERLREGMQYRTNERDKFWRERDEAEVENVALRDEVRRLRIVLRDMSNDPRYDP